MREGRQRTKNDNQSNYLFLSSSTSLLYVGKGYYKEMVSRMLRAIHIEIRPKLTSDGKERAKAMGCPSTFTLKALFFFKVIADLPTEHLVPQNNVMFTEYIWSHRTIF